MPFSIVPQKLQARTVRGFLWGVGSGGHGRRRRPECHPCVDPERSPSNRRLFDKAQGWRPRKRYISIDIARES